MNANVYATSSHDGDSIFENSSKGIADAATDARAAAKVAAQNVKDGVGWSVYKAAFGVSFGVVFTGVFLTELLPVQNVLRRGLEDGADAALDAIAVRKIDVDPETHDEHHIPEPIPVSSVSKTARSRKPVAAAKGVDLKPARRTTRVSR